MYLFDNKEHPVNWLNQFFWENNGRMNRESVTQNHRKRPILDPKKSVPLLTRLVVYAKKNVLGLFSICPIHLLRNFFAQIGHTRLYHCLHSVVFICLANHLEFQEKLDKLSTSLFVSSIDDENKSESGFLITSDL